MKQLKLILITLVSFCFVGTGFAKSVQTSPLVGTWTTIDDKTGKPRAIVRISKSRSGIYSAKILKVLNKQADDVGVCRKCPGKLKNRKIIGLRFLWGMKKDGDNTWSGGTILDPKSGKTYRCKMTLKSNKALDVRGYVGFSLFGRTQKWYR